MAWRIALFLFCAAAALPGGVVLAVFTGDERWLLLSAASLVFFYAG